MTSPIRPEDVESHKIQALPAVVFEVFNELIVRELSGKTARVLQKDVVDALIKKGFKSEDIFAKKLLDVEDAYKARGWNVVYDKPAYNESYPAVFIFTRP